MADHVDDEEVESPVRDREDELSIRAAKQSINATNIIR